MRDRIRGSQSLTNDCQVGGIWMKIKEKIAETVTETAEKVRYMLKNEDYFVNISKKGLDVKKVRPTKHTIKWRSKNY